MQEIPFIGGVYKVVDGVYKGFIGKCVSYDLEHDLPVILQKEDYTSCAVRINEIQGIKTDDKKDISHLQKN